VTGLPEDKRFEHFAAYLTVRKHYAETFDTSDIITGSGGDTGIDALAIIANNVLITDVDQVEELVSVNGYLEVTFAFVQADRGTSFQSAKIGQLGYGIRDFFNEHPQMVRNQTVSDAAFIMETLYKKSAKFTRGNPTCRIYYVTTGKWQNDQNLEARLKTEISDINATGLFTQVDLTPIGADGIQRLYNQAKNAITREFSFPNRTVVPDIAGVKEAHLGFLPASEFMKIICDDDGTIIKTLFYENVRDWQDYNGVNREIRDTLTAGDRDRFVLMNNGITIIARSLQATANRFVVGDFQVVNGCQTSHVLHDNQAHLEGVRVPVRLIATQDEGVFASIIRATNRQSEVKEDQFFALTDFAKRLEQFFQSGPVARHLYYERRSRQYDSHTGEKTRIISHPNLVKAYGAMFGGEPHRTTRDFAALSAKVGKEMFLDDDRLEPYYTAASAFYRLEFEFRNQRLDPKYKTARFALLYAARLLANTAQLPARNSREMARYCATIDSKLWEPGEADSLFAAAASVVEEVAAHDLKRDTVRTQPFTDNLEKRCLAMSALGTAN